jgi:shikimate 5-dehydrogenase
VDNAEPLPTERRGGDLSIPRGADGRFILPAMRFISYAEAATSLETADILIDATPLGMGAADGAVVPLEALRPGLVVFDAVYGHGETAIIRGAREAGAVAIDGLGMLIEQAALTVEIWAQERGTPVEVSRATMRRAALEQVLSVK